MKRLAPALAILVAACAAGPGGPGRGGHGIPGGRLAANPSALIAADIAFNREAQESGQWTAFRDFAAPDAVMFVPEPVKAEEWLKGRADPPASVVWQPHEAWISCDGSLGATRGAWQRPDGSTGYFTTVWQRQKKGEYKWVLDQGDTLQTPLKAPDMLSASVADCVPPSPDAVEISKVAREHVDHEGGDVSDDATLAYHYDIRFGTIRTVVVTIRRDGKMHEAFRSVVSGGK